MGRLPSITRWVVATALVCAAVGLLLKATDPVPQETTTARLTEEKPRRLVKRRSAPPPAPPDAGRRPPAPPAAAVRGWGHAERPRGATGRDATWFASAPAPAAPFGARPPAAGGPLLDRGVPDEVASEPVARLRTKDRRPRRKRRARTANDGGSRSGRLRRQTSPSPARPPSRVGQDAPGGGAASDVTFSSGDDVQFPTAGRVAIPIDENLGRRGGSVSLWVQPRWERGNRDDATLVQLGHGLRLVKQAHALRLEAADVDPADGDDPTGFGVSIGDWSPGEWHHVAATWDGAALSLFVDGHLVARRRGGGPIAAPPSRELLVGSEASERRRVAPGLIGRIDLRDRPLGEDEVARTYRDATGEDHRGDAERVEDRGRDRGGRPTRDHRVGGGPERSAER